MLRVEFIALVYDRSVVTLRSPSTLRECLCLAVPCVDVAKHMNLGLNPVEGIAQVTASHALVADPIEYVMRWPVCDKHVHVRGNLIPHSLNLCASCVVPCPIAELRLRRAAVNLRPGQHHKLIFKIDDVLAIRTYELPHRVHPSLAAQMIEKEVMIAANKNNPLELLRLLTEPAHRGLGLLAATIPGQVACMN